MIIDYGLGNLGSIKNMLKEIGSESVITSDVARIRKAKKLILPGVGAFDNGMENIKKLKLQPLLNDLVLNQKIPILGICLGMQLMTEKSEEGRLPGLGWIKGEVKKFQFKNNHLKIPHMGWNTVKICKKNHLTEGLGKDTKFYFVHSYKVMCGKKEDVLLETNYGESFPSGFCRGNIYGVQFHPEKSHKYGLKLLSNFCEV